MNKSKKEIRLKVFKKYDGRCAYCGCELTTTNFQIDHIKPKSRHLPREQQGEDKLFNYNPSCSSCNTSKWTFSLDEWKESIESKYDMLHKNSSLFRILIRFGLVKKTSNKVMFHFEKYNK